MDLDDRSDFDAAFEAVVTELFESVGLPVPPLGPVAGKPKRAAAQKRWELEAKRRRRLAAALRAARRRDARRGRS